MDMSFGYRSSYRKKVCDPTWQNQRNSLLDQYLNITDGNGAMTMSMGIRNLEFVVKEGNPDSIGIRFAGAQDNILSNVKVRFESEGFAGIYSLIGTNSVAENIEVYGGKFGIFGGDSRWPSFNNVKLINQSIVAISGPSSGLPLSLNGFYIEKDHAPAIADVGINYRYYGKSNSGGAYALSDGVIKFRESNNEPAIDNREDRQVSLQNVYFEKAGKIIKNSDQDIVEGNSTGWTKVSLYANVLQDFVSEGDLNMGTRVVDLEKTEENLVQIARTNVSAPNIQRLLLKHGVETDKLPSPDVVIKKSKENDPSYIYVKHKGIDALSGDTARDNIPANADISSQLQAIINGCQSQEECFILFGPGTYPLKNTVELKSNTHLMGIANFLTEFITNPSWSTETATDVFRSPDDPNAITTLAFFKSNYNSDPRQATFNMYHWRSGRNSLIYGLLSTRSFSPSNPNYSAFKPRAEYLVTDNGGGRWFGNNTSGNGGNDKWFPNYRGIKIIGTTQPLTIYGLDPEDAGYNCIRDVNACNDGDGRTYPPIDSESMQVEIRNARNISIRGFKCEDYNSVNIFNSTNIFANGIGGCTDWYFENVNQSLVLNIAPKGNASGGRGVSPLYEEKRGSDVLVIKQKESAVAIQTGDLPDFSVWDFDGVISTNTPTPIQSATPTPTQTPGASLTPTMTSTPGPSPTPSATPLPTNTNTPGSTATPTQIQGNICGKSDVNGDGVFTLVDFAQFGLAYGNGQNTCSDTQVDYGVCGGRDVDRDGFLKLYDFGGENIGFSQRYYPKTSCAL